MPAYTHILFDLDGTLIDSAPAILASFRDAFAHCGRTPARVIDESIIGPPLLETLELLSGSRDADLIGRLAEGFKASYDSTGYKATLAYGGVGEMLAGLRSAGLNLSIATNKRIHPTRLILEHLGWSAYFEAVYALDLFPERLPHKAAMIGRLLEDRNIPRSRAVYVGDRAEDRDAAFANALPFIAATWGYGSLPGTDHPGGERAAPTPMALLEMLNGE